MNIGDDTITLGGLITSVVVDIKERDQVLCMNSGYFRCPYCYHKGATYPRHPSVCCHFN
jgi:hypothetical protein